MSNDKNIIYVEKDNNAPYIFLYGQMLRNVVITLDSDEEDYKELSRGEVWALTYKDCDKLIKGVERTCIDFDIKYIAFEALYNGSSNDEEEFERILQLGEL